MHATSLAQPVGCLSAIHRGRSWLTVGHLDMRDNAAASPPLPITDKWRKRRVRPRSAAFRIIAARALIAAFDPDECGLAAFRALRHAAVLAAGQVDDLALREFGRATAPRRHEADIDEVLFDDVADRCQK